MEEMMRMIIRRGQFLRNVISEKEEAVKKSPEGTLRISGHKGKTDYYHAVDDSTKKGVYIGSGEVELARKLAQKSYDQKVLSSAQKELRFLNYIFTKYYKYDGKERIYKPRSETVEQIYKSMTEERQKLVVPVVKTDEQYVKEWEEQSYEGKPFAEDDPEYYTEQGERVRSKSEVLIANMLYRKGIPYKYECPVNLKQMGKVYTDFRILDVKRRKEWYWEHLGMMDKAEYCARSLEKIIAYEKTGIIPGRELIITHETTAHPINMRVIEKLVDSYLL